MSSLKIKETEVCLMSKNIVMLSTEIDFTFEQLCYETKQLSAKLVGLPLSDAVKVHIQQKINEDSDKETELVDLEDIAANNPRKVLSLIADPSTFNNLLINNLGNLGWVNLIQFASDDLKALFATLTPDHYEFKNHGIQLIFKTIANQQITKNDIDNLIDYLSGQLSDGWGENGTSKSISSPDPYAENSYHIQERFMDNVDQKALAAFKKYQMDTTFSYDGHTTLMAAYDELQMKRSKPTANILAIPNFITFSQWFNADVLLKQVMPAK